MQYQGIIFDLDGVLCSTDEYHYRAWMALADRLGIPFDRERNGLLRGVSRMDSLNIILEKSDKAYSQEEKNAYRSAKKIFAIKAPKDEKITPEEQARIDEFMKYAKINKSTESQ